MCAVIIISQRQKYFLIYIWSFLALTKILHIFMYSYIATLSTVTNVIFNLTNILPTLLFTSINKCRSTIKLRTSFTIYVFFYFCKVKMPLFTCSVNIPIMIYDSKTMCLSQKKNPREINFTENYGMTRLQIVWSEKQLKWLIMLCKKKYKTILTCFSHGKPFSIRLKGDRRITIKNILILAWI